MPHEEPVSVIIIRSDGTRQTARLVWETIIRLLQRGIRVQITSLGSTTELTEAGAIQLQSQIAGLHEPEPEPPTPEPEPPPPIPLPEPPPPTPEPEPTEPEPENDWISQSPGVFELKNDRLTGEILYIISTKFDPFWYGQNLRSIIRIRDLNNVDLVLKENNLAFTATERDERITIDENVFGNTEVIVKAFVWNDNAQAFSGVLEFPVKSGDPPMVPPPTSTKPALNLIQALPFIGIGALFLHHGLKNKRVGKK